MKPLRYAVKHCKHLSPLGVSCPLRVIVAAQATWPGRLRQAAHVVGPLFFLGSVSSSHSAGFRLPCEEAPPTDLSFLGIVASRTPIFGAHPPPHNSRGMFEHHFCNHDGCWRACIYKHIHCRILTLPCVMHWASVSVRFQILGSKDSPPPVVHWFFRPLN